MENGRWPGSKRPRLNFDPAYRQAGLLCHDSGNSNGGSHPHAKGACGAPGMNPYSTGSFGFAAAEQGFLQEVFKVKLSGILFAFLWRSYGQEARIYECGSADV